jgi:predicted phage-related endonuclease
MPKPGYISPSKFKNMMTCTRSGQWPGETAITYAEEVALEIIGVELPDFDTEDMEHGREYEPFAVQAYERETFTKTVACTETLYHPDFNFICGHVDRFVDDDGILEVKCPKLHNHYKNFKSNLQLKLYSDQIQGYLDITGRKWIDFVSYSPFMPDGLKLKIVRVERDNAHIAELRARYVQFWQLVQNEVEFMKSKLL